MIVHESFRCPWCATVVDRERETKGSRYAVYEKQDLYCVGTDDRRHEEQLMVRSVRLAEGEIV